MRTLRLLPLLLLCGCSWSRFDDISEDTPIVLLKKPGVLDRGFGVSLATATREGRVQLLAGGAPLVSGAAAYDLGTADQPSIEAIDTGYCRGSAEQCFLSSSPAGFGVASAPGMNHDLCFVVGSGEAPDGHGLVVRCDDDVEYHLPVPESVVPRLEFTIDEHQGEDVVFATDRDEAPALLAGARVWQAAWFYASLDRSPVELVPPEVPASYGRTVAVVRVGGAGRIFAVGAPDEGRLLLFKSVDGASATYVGCLGDMPGFSRALGAGPVLAGDGDDELVVSDDRTVYVFDGAKLFELPPAASAQCSLSALPEGALVTSFGCGSTKNVADCEVSRFGQALAVGDIDGDGDGEVIVGAPGMTVRDTKRAGAVLVYDVDAPRDEDFAEIQFISSAEQDDELGAVLAAPFLGDRHVIAAGAPGNGKVALFYCSSLLPPDKRPSRCK